MSFRRSRRVTMSRRMGYRGRHRISRGKSRYLFRRGLRRHHKNSAGYGFRGGIRL